MKNSDMPTVPQNGAFSGADDFNSSDDMGGSGLTKREHLASMVLAGMMPMAHREGVKSRAKFALEQADALLAALEES